MDPILRAYGWCKVNCRDCGEIFEVHPLANALAPDADLCQKCRTVKRLIASAEEKAGVPERSGKEKLVGDVPFALRLFLGNVSFLLVILGIWLFGVAVGVWRP